MKIKINIKQLFNLLNNINFSMEKKRTSSLPFNLKISIEKKAISFYITDLNMSLKEEIPYLSESKLITSLPMYTFHKIIRKINSQLNVELFFEPSLSPIQVFINSHSYRFMLPCFSSIDFPTFENEEYNFNFKLFSYDLYNVLSTVNHAISFDEEKYYLNGVYTHIVTSNQKKKIRFVATDIYRLALGEIDAPDHAEFLSGIIIPKNAILKVIKLLKYFKGDVILKVSLKKIFFKINKTILISKLINGKFPEYNLVIPRNKKIFKITVKDLVDSINLVKSISSLNNIVIKMHIKNNKLIVSVNEKTNFAAVSKIDIDYIDTPISIFFNSQYLIDVLANLQSKKIYFKVDSYNSSVLITDSCKYNFLFVLMPMQI